MSFFIALGFLLFGALALSRLLDALEKLRRQVEETMYEAARVNRQLEQVRRDLTRSSN